ncbi:hypothetical protein Pla123a_36470 [Posidoniimonas polymericola]|uniref:Lumazine-binding domain protein n=1 Tax=Posidoniimonas polymericola TaxID=2528002 RepID=A0A5C5YFA3_9BACT|nr:hypothetical protein [Posidoniimonas polymericola]TWT73754.1 hypothetical protein Pla123a_36470 [Posidoniimonas polymericola]
MSIRKLSLASALLSLSLGCSGGDAPSPQASTAAAPATAAAKSGAPTENPIAAAAYDFMDAVFANDIARATQRLTPEAIQNLQAQDKRFEWGAAAAKLEMGEVKQDGSGEAAVQCFVSQGATPGDGPSELLCVLRQVGGEWLVYGVAWQGGDTEEPQIVNFESPAAPAAPAAPKPPSGDRYVDTPAPQIPPAQESSSAAPRTANGQPGYLVQ